MLEQRFSKTRLSLAASEITRDESGLIRIKIADDRIIDSQDMQVITVAIGYLSTGGPRPVVVELGAGSAITKAAARKMINSGVCHHMQCLAFVATSFAQHIKMTLTMVRQKPVTPIKVFRQATSALRWLEDKMRITDAQGSTEYVMEKVNTVPYSLNF